MKRNWKDVLYDIVLILSLFIVGIWMSDNYDYSIDDGGFFLGVSVVILITFLWKKINNKFF